MDVWITTNPRRRRGKFLKTTKTRREAAKIFWKQQDPGQKIRPKIPYGGVLNVISPVIGRKVGVSIPNSSVTVTIRRPILMT